MLEPIVLNKKDEYFLSIAKQGLHSFIMLGVIENAKLKLLARVGKTDDIDPDSESKLTKLKKELMSETLARIADEGIYCTHERIVNINYKAYAINYKQLKEFLGMIAEIEEKQLENSTIKDNINIRYTKYGVHGVKKEAIKCYVRIEEDGDRVTFEYKEINDEKIKPIINTKEYKEISEIIAGAQKITRSNTCRTSAKNIVESILGFVTDVSKYFFISPKYESQLISGIPNQESFYILPPPPNTADLNPNQISMLKKLYKRMEEIPKLNPESSKTRKKFDALKLMYKDIAGENNLSAKDLLEKILAHENHNQTALFEKRSPNFLSKFFSTSSSTERMFNNLKQSLSPDKEERTFPAKF